MSEEKPEVRERYGRNSFGQSCLLARRLVERGVPFITINSGGWDTHRDNFGRMKVLLPPLDQGFPRCWKTWPSAGCSRAPSSPGSASSAARPRSTPAAMGRRPAPLRQRPVGGRGRRRFQGRSVVGETDAKGEFPKNRTLYPWDLSASMYTLLGIDPQGRLPHPHGCVAYVTPPPAATCRAADC